MANKFCQYCGSQMDDNSTFCQSCGKSQNTPSPSQPASGTSTYTPQPTYSAPYANYNQMNTFKDTPLTVGQYIGMFILSAIPLVGLILLLVWAFGSEANTNKKNYSRAVLLLGLIAGGITILFYAILIPILMNVFSSF